MFDDFDPRRITTQQYRSKIRELEARLARERAACEKTESELAWWQQGMNLFAPERVEDLEDLVAPVNLSITSNGSKPSLRLAVLQVMRESSRKSWKAPDLIGELETRGWMPNGAHREHLVRSKLSELSKKGELRKVAYGTYALPRPVEATPT